MRIGTSLSEIWTVAGVALRKSTHFSLRRLGAIALVVLMLCAAGAVSSQTLSGETLQLHEGELVSSAAASLSNASGTLGVERSTLGGLAPGRSTGLSGLQLEGSVVAVPEPALGLQGMVAALGLGLLAWRRGGGAGLSVRRTHRGAGSLENSGRTRSLATTGVRGSAVAEVAVRRGLAGWLAALCLVLGWCLTASPAWSQEAAYQGRVTDGSGIPQTGQVDLELRIFDFDTAGTLLYKELHLDVPLSHAGVFSVALGGGTDPFLSYDASLFAGGDPRYLEVLVDGELMTPRQRIGTVPTALVAEEWAREAALQSQVSLNDGRITVLELVPQGPHDRSGTANTAVGADALLSNTIGTRNTASGDAALSSNTTGSDNTASGHLALFGNISGSGNTALGSNAGELTTGDNNILIDNVGVAGESNTIRIGDSQSQTFVAGISNTTPAGPVETVVVTPEGQLGVGTSPAPSTFVIGAHEFNEIRSNTRVNGLAATGEQHDRCIRPNALTGGRSVLQAQLPPNDSDIEPLFCTASANLSHLPHNATITQLGCTLANATDLTTPFPSSDVDDHTSDTAVVALIRVDADANGTSLAEVVNAASQEASPATPCSGACQLDRSAASYHLKAILPVQDAFTQGALGSKLISCTITIQP